MNEQGEPHDDSARDAGEFEWSDIDQEWADLMEAETDAIDVPEDILRQDFQEIIGLLAEKMDSYGLQRVVDRSQEREMELCGEFIRMYRENRLEQLSWSGAEADDGAYARATAEALRAYQDRREAETYVLNGVVSLRHVSQHPELYPLGAWEINEVRLDMLAKIQFHLRMEENWVRFFYDMTAGDGEYVPYYIHQNPYVQDALDELPLYEEAREQKWEILERALEMTGVGAIEENPGAVVAMMADMIDMQTIAAQPIHDERERANRNAELWEFGRVIGLENDTMHKLADFFDHMYPIIEQ